MPHNPKWSRDELVLALDLYLQRRNKIPGVSDPEVIAVSELLQKMAGPAAASFKRYRSADAVAMKLGNFQSIDPQYTSAGKKAFQQAQRVTVKCGEIFQHGRQICMMRRSPLRQYTRAEMRLRRLKMKKTRKKH